MGLYLRYPLRLRVNRDIRQVDKNTKSFMSIKLDFAHAQLSKGFRLVPGTEFGGRVFQCRVCATTSKKSRLHPVLKAGTFTSHVQSRVKGVGEIVYNLDSR